jgi:hypothetical protein
MPRSLSERHATRPCHRRYMCYPTATSPLPPRHVKLSSCAPRCCRTMPTSKRLVDGRHTLTSSASSTFLHHGCLCVGILRLAISDNAVTDESSTWAHLRFMPSPPAPSPLLQPAVTGSPNRRPTSPSRMTPVSSCSH